MRGHGHVETPLYALVTVSESLGRPAHFEPPETLPDASRKGAPGWRWWASRALGVLVAAVAVATLVYVISDRVAARYQSSATVRVSVQTTSGISDPDVTAANDLASQFAQLASSTPVLEAAAVKLGVPRKDLEGAVSAGTIAAQNLIRVGVSGSGPDQAQARATAVAKAFVRYLDRLDAQQVGTYERTVIARLRPLNREIDAARKRLSSPEPEVQRNATVLLSGLLGQQATVLSSIAQSSAAGQPSVQLVAPGGAGSKVSPKPSLYAGIAFLAVLLLLGRFVYVLGVRRASAREAPV